MRAHTQEPPRPPCGRSKSLKASKVIPDRIYNNARARSIDKVFTDKSHLRRKCLFPEEPWTHDYDSLDSPLIQPSTPKNAIANRSKLENALRGSSTVWISITVSVPVRIRASAASPSRISNLEFSSIYGLATVASFTVPWSIISIAIAVISIVSVPIARNVSISIRRPASTIISRGWWWHSAARRRMQLYFS